MRAKYFQVLVDRTRSSNSGEDHPGLKFESNITENDFNKHKALNTPVRWENILNRNYH